jgi:hypothetical protein
MSGETTGVIAVPLGRTFREPAEEVTLKIWPARSDPRLRRRRADRLGPKPTELTRPLSANSVLRTRLGVPRRRSAAIGVLIGSIAVLGIALSLASYSRHDDQPTLRLAPAAAADHDLPRTGALPDDAAPPRTLNLVTNVDIKATYSVPAGDAASISERQTYVSRDRPRVSPKKPARPAEPPAKEDSTETAPPVDDNPYETPRSKIPAPTLTAQPAVDENPY